MSIFDKLFSRKQEEETPKVELSVKSIEQAFVNRIQHRILEYKRFEDCGINMANCIFMDVTEAKDINDHLILLQKNQKDIGNFFDNMYHFTSSKDDFLTSSRGYGCHRDEVFSEYFNDLCALTFKKLKRIGIEEAKFEIASHAEWMESYLGVIVREDYVALKIKEAELRNEQILLAEQEKERRRDERMAQQEYKKAILKAEKDEEKITKALEEEKTKYAKAQNEKEIERLRIKISQLESELQEAQILHQKALSMAQQTRAGYVYIISNIGSFGENIHKIGLTRRLNPMDRIDELSNASVPFPFDVHAFIYCDDAPALEAKLHQTFSDKRVNAINHRKEYFNVTLEEIKKAIQNMGFDIKFFDHPNATQYYNSIKLRSIE